MDSFARYSYKSGNEGTRGWIPLLHITTNLEIMAPMDGFLCYIYLDLEDLEDIQDLEDLQDLQDLQDLEDLQG